MKLPLPARIPILYLILIVLIAVGVVPLYFYATKMVGRNRETLGSNEKLLQNSVTTTLAQSIAQREKDIGSTLSSLAFSIKVTSSGNLSGKNIESPDVRALLQNYIEDPDSIVPYARLVNTENQSSMNMGTIEPDTFLLKELDRGLAAARAGREYSGDPLSIGSGKQARTVMVVGKPVLSDDHVYLGSLELVIDLQYLVKQLQQAKNTQNLDTFVVDRSGRVVASPSPRYATGQDMNSNELVKNFVDQKGKVPVAVTMDYSVQEGKNRIPMLGTYFPVTGLGWAVVAQKTQEEAYIDITDMRRDAIRAALIAIAFSIFVGIWAARRLTIPLHVLTESSRTIAGGDFTHRVRLKSRTEFGELAQTFNTMTDDLEQFVDDLKKAAEENRTLFLSSIQMLAGAVDEKDPYTRGHSDRVTRYSVLIATEMGLKEEDIEKIRVSAQLHDVGKIGIEDRILKKPGALTPEEFEIMKTHTTKGAAILRPVEALRDMLPGIELHHESLDGRGYPHGLKGEQIPLMPRIIMVADTFDAMTTNRPYQAAMDPEYVIRIINSLAATKFDATVVAAMTKVFETGKLRIHRAAAVSGEEAAAAAAVSAPTQA
ncbi:MAG TPA: HD domain-containing phosphohydrolase [Candidatus Dormibacteraeota bacterium]|jgi:HD-GYP domain-containing protein (c-di-GMP phosphodiesterase class II)|nr:HD domain-containing phosphohydrolase [Candidatus Dormibacteraeota bacterium]